MVMATGVLPLPPAVRLPTQITGTGARQGVAVRALCATLAPYNIPSGLSSFARNPGLCQKSGARIDQTLKNGDTAAHRAGLGGRAARRGQTGFLGQGGIIQQPARLARDIAAIFHRAEALRDRMAS